jgi:hypothetical protein
MPGFYASSEKEITDKTKVSIPSKKDNKNKYEGS